MRVAARRSPRTAALVRLYPRGWRDRHEVEMGEVLADTPATIGTAVDLVRGAIDAHLHGEVPSRLPGLAAASAGAGWIVIAAAVLVQPVPPDWPGYLYDVVPLALAVVGCLTVAMAGAWLRLGDAVGGFETLALDLALVGHLAWAISLVGVLAQVDYVVSVGVSTLVAALGTVLLAAALLRAGDALIGALLGVAGVALLLPAVTSLAVVAGWFAVGAAWTAIGFAELAEAGRLRALADDGG